MTVMAILAYLSGGNQTAGLVVTSVLAVALGSTVVPAIIQTNLRKSRPRRRRRNQP